MILRQSITWKLWDYLQTPPARHVIYLRVAMPNGKARRAKNWWPGATSGRVSKVLAALVAPLVLPLFVFAAPLLFFIFVFNSTAYSMVWSLSISSTLVREREVGMYTMTSLSPVGPLGVNWAICTGCIHRNQTFKRLRTIIRALLFTSLIAASFVTLIFLILLIGNSGSGRAQYTPAQVRLLTLTPVYAFTFIAAFYIDHVQSVVLGSLVGIMIPHYARNYGNAQVWSVGGLLSLQVTTYLLAALTGLVILPDLYNAFQLRGWIADASIPLLSFILAYATREAIVTTLWHALMQTLNTETNELDGLLSYTQIDKA